MTNIPREYLDLSNDFGFTAVDEDEVTEPIITNVKSATVDELRSKLLEVEKLIMPLLVNLLKDADTKEYIRWPNRKDVIEKQIERILLITRQ
jgi:hypothetical protein